MNDTTPLMAQYNEIKSKYNDCVLLFRVGDFYETFFEDAVTVSRILNIALTTRDKKKPNPVPLAGVPFHAVETYINRLLAAGQKVAVCEQVEDPAKAQGLVKREVVEVLTPGTTMSTQLLEEKENNFCLALHIDGMLAGAALIDVSTGDFLCGQDETRFLHNLLQGRRIKEIVCARGFDTAGITDLIESLGSPVVNEIDDRVFDLEPAHAALRRQFDTGGQTEAPDLGPAAARAAGALLSHCHELRGDVLPQVVKIDPLYTVDFLVLDDETIGNLELFEALRGGDTHATLVKTIDRTLTPMGGREIRARLQKPLCNVTLISQRLDAVEELCGSVLLEESVMTLLKGVQDIQRLAARIAARKAIPREFLALTDSLTRIPQLAKTLEGSRSEYMRNACLRLGDHVELNRTIERAIVDDPPGHLREGGVFRQGYAPDLDSLITENEKSKRWIATLEKRERDRTGIASLKVGYNRVFGYYIEVSNAHIGSVPDHYVAKQTLVNAQRYYTQELKEKEQRILETEERRVACEQALYEALCLRIARALPGLQSTSQAIADIDVVHSLAVTAKQHRYNRPVIDDSTTIELKASRHPVLERRVHETFVPNDLYLDLDKKQFALITGPNMSGKSTFLRQVALAVILAQMGSFIPAERARIGLVDKVFTRVGASDRLSRGESTFLVEMKETAHILDNVTDRSLVLLDEVGRGTSTFDGLSIAWAVTEYLLQGVRARPKTLFATHFHELNQLRHTYPRLVNLKIAIREWEGGIIFLRKIVPGVSDRSYGIHAARIAGLPAMVLKRAEEILESLELRRDLLHQGVTPDDALGDQYSLFGRGAPGSRKRPDDAHRFESLRKRIEQFDIDGSTPIEALQFMKSLKDDISRHRA